MVVTMGCNVACPYVPGAVTEDWGLEDPTGKSDETFLETIEAIENKIIELRRRLKENTWDY